MERIESPNFEQKNKKEFVSLKESGKVAVRLLERFKEEIRANFQKDVDGWGEPYADYQKSISHFLGEVPEEILERYQGHGITKGFEADQLAAALNILANKSIKGECGPVGGETYGYGAYKRGDFLVISNFDKRLAVTKEEEDRQVVISNEIGWQAEIGAFVVDTRYYPLVDELKKLFPDVNIIKANEIPEFIKKQTEEKNGE